MCARRLAGGPLARPVLIQNSDADTWSHGIFSFEEEISAFQLASISVLETGPLRGVIRVVSQYGASTLTQRFRLTHGQKQLEVRTIVDFHEKLALLKLSFMANIQHPEPVHSMPSGYIYKQSDGLEEPAHMWVAVVDSADGYGLALLNDGRYSFSCNGNDLRMVAARGAVFADHFGKRDDQVESMDQGELRFTYALMPCSKEHFQEAANAADLLNRPPVMVMEGHHDGILPPVGQGIHIGSDHVTVQAAKPAEDGKGYVI